MKRQKAVKKPVLKGEPVFLYTSKCCNAAANKAPVTAFGKHSEEAKTQGLGSWRCNQCSKPCACNRSKNSLDKVT